MMSLEGGNTYYSRRQERRDGILLLLFISIFKLVLHDMCKYIVKERSNVAYFLPIIKYIIINTSTIKNMSRYMWFEPLEVIIVPILLRVLLKRSVADPRVPPMLSSMLF